MNYPDIILSSVLHLLPLSAHLRLRMCTRYLLVAVMTLSRLILRVDVPANSIPSVETLARIALARCSPPYSSSPRMEFAYFHNPVSGAGFLRAVYMKFSIQLETAATATLFPKCAAIFRFPLAYAYTRISEAIAAPNGDCARVQVVATHPEKKFLQIPASAYATSLPHLVYVAYLGAPSPVGRRVLEHPIGARKVLGPYLRRNGVDKDVAVELSFRGGGEWFLHERVSCDFGAQNGLEDETVRFEVSNVQRVDRVHIAVSASGKLTANDGAIAQACRWLEDLWARIIEDANKETASAAHTGLAQRKFGIC
ncbi:hypothetical protein HDU83_006049 [Entophlyctis luteolus]|nr:hypothetical protein HDU82_006097 [Entophlyctis luteolus]KAJ3342601.1 hypothetical protein HDU83_006049 [Entophlyctis luteolus]KAJ3384251.1 hypothetical protein HDU84_003061 [Entophlyctis sp. JEL0112]